jgi:hypothetical protein
VLAATYNKETGGVLEFAVKYQDVGKEIPRHNH